MPATRRRLGSLPRLPRFSCPLSFPFRLLSFSLIPNRRIPHEKGRLATVRRWQPPHQFPPLVNHRHLLIPSLTVFASFLRTLRSLCQHSAAFSIEEDSQPTPSSPPPTDTVTSDDIRRRPQLIHLHLSVDSPSLSIVIFILFYFYYLSPSLSFSAADVAAVAAVTTAACRVSSAFPQPDNPPTNILNFPWLCQRWAGSAEEVISPSTARL